MYKCIIFYLFLFVLSKRTLTFGKISKQRSWAQMNQENQDQDVVPQDFVAHQNHQNHQKHHRR